MFKNKFVRVREKENYDFNTKHNSHFQNVGVIEPAVNRPQSACLRIPRVDFAICPPGEAGGGRAQQRGRSAPEPRPQEISPACCSPASKYRAFPANNQMRARV